MTGSGVVVGVSVSHHDATVEQLEAADVESQGAAAAALADDPGVSEALVLQTCNRVEGYVVAADEAVGREALADLVADVDPSVVREMGHEESLRHLLRVAAGLESLVVGEDQILGQVREALADAQRAGAVGPVLEDGVTKALHVGERVRTETAINEGAVSLASAAVRLAAAECDLDGATGLVVGAGEMGRLAAESLAAAVDRLLVANRTVPNAAHVAESVDVEASAVGLDDLPAATQRADVVVSATGSREPIFDRETLADVGETFVVDAAQPRDVPPGLSLPAVTVRDLDALEAHTAETRRQREAAARTVEVMVEEALEHLLTQYKRQRADRVISAMYESAERIKAEELERALASLDLDPEDEAVVEAMADAIVSQLLAAPTSSLREAAAEDDWSTIHTALQLFDPSDLATDDGAGAPAFPAEAEAIPDEVRDELPAPVREQLDD